MKLTQLTPWFVAGLLAIGVHAQTTVQTLTPADDTFIWLGGGENTAQGAVNPGVLFSFNAVGGGHQAYPLLRFDLSSLDGSTVTTDATLTLYYAAAHSSTDPRTIDVKLLTQGFDSATTTFNNYSVSNFGTTLDTFSGQVAAPGTLTFEISKATIQSWIDNPTGNLGIALVAGWESRDVYFSSSEGTNAPTLSFSTASAIPEPSTYAAIAGCVALAGTVLLRRRRATTALTRA